MNISEKSCGSRHTFGKVIKRKEKEFLLAICYFWRVTNYQEKSDMHDKQIQSLTFLNSTTVITLLKVSAAFYIVWVTYADWTLSKFWFITQVTNGIYQKWRLSHVSFQKWLTEYLWLSMYLCKFKLYPCFLL